MNAIDVLTQGDALTRWVAWVLLAMSVISWMLIVYKTALLHVCKRDLRGCKDSLLLANDWLEMQAQWTAIDTWQLFAGLLIATQAKTSGALAASASADDQITRQLRDALNQVRERLQYGQDILATIGATAPFVGLLGTVWGIFHALTSLATAGQYTLDKVAQPVGEALVMTAAGLAVAIPAVIAFNLLGRRLTRLETELQALAFDLRAMSQASPKL
ncbi:MAG: MotA/TolQ/ExbB proton channel family protein [Betaproteobacteria bacterium]|nr:MotA/TolQ/ExbB proton channel family protein [Betaproteobacteria bacterium]